MGRKTGAKLQDINKLVKEQNNYLERSDVTANYMDFIGTGITKESLSVDKDSKVIEQIIEKGKDKVVVLKIDDLTPSPKNCYNRIEGEKREELISSLKGYGQITPIIVRPRECVESYQDEITTPYEILVGHSRVDCLKDIAKGEGKEATVNAIIMEVGDIEATLLIAQSNIQRDKVSEIELARAYRNTYEAVKQDKDKNLKKGGFVNKISNVEISTFSPMCQFGTSGERTDELVAKKYGISARTLHRKMSLAYCSPEVVKMYEKKKLNQEQIESISKIDQGTQREIISTMKNEHYKMNNDSVKELAEAYNDWKEHGTNNIFPYNKIKEILAKGNEVEMKKELEKEKSLNQKRQVRREKKIKEYENSKDTYSIPKSMFKEKIFPAGMKEEDKEAYIVKSMGILLNEFQSVYDRKESFQTNVEYIMSLFHDKDREIREETI